LKFLAQKLKRLEYRGKTSRIALILNSWLSNEELFLLHKIFKTDLNAEKVFFADPPQEEGDNFLLTPERSPNNRGAREMGFDIKPVHSKALAEETDLIVAFGSFLAEADLKGALGKIETKVLFTSHVSGLNSLFDIMLPTPLIAEKGGSLTNVDGRVQKFSAVLDPPGDSLPEWRMLAELGREAGINVSFYREFTSPEEIFEGIGKEISFFRVEK
ncbi:MAG: molybdopterin-dependent oxidoreductase, partial [Candidatus Aminicenantes bacterium]|nr:molybdopterin-dependent oxidoreductase [Candidatus Aminicenantes bacterium]